MAASKRQLIAPRGDKRFVRRDAKGRIVESDDVGRSLTQDRRRAAKTAAKPGQGDKGDRKAGTTANQKATMKKTASKKSAATKRSDSKSSSATRKSVSPATKGASRSAAKKATRKSVGAAGPKSPAKKSAPTRPNRMTASRTPNAIQLLEADHVTVRELLKQLEATTSRGPKTRQDLLARLRIEIEVHTTIEEEIFYPAFKAAGEKQDDQEMYFEAVEEHRAAGDFVLPDLLKTDPASDCFGGRAKVLKELIEHHAEEEEREMFPRAREILSADELNSLGERMLSRKAELLAQSAPQKSVVSRLLSAVVGGRADSAAPSDEGSEDQAPAARIVGKKSARNGATPNTSGR